MRYFLSVDNDGHWYLVPLDRRRDWHAWADLPEDDERAWDAPDYAKRIDGPYMLSFTDPREEW